MKTLIPDYRTWPKQDLADEATRLAGLARHLEAEVVARKCGRHEGARPYSFLTPAELRQERARLAKSQTALEAAR